MDGTYTLCFSNYISTVTAKMVMFQLDVGDSPALDMPTRGAGDNITGKESEVESRALPVLL